MNLDAIKLEESVGSGLITRGDMGSWNGKEIPRLGKNQGNTTIRRLGGVRNERQAGATD